MWWVRAIHSNPQVAEKPLLQPATFELVMQYINHRPLYFHHQIMPVVTVFTTNVHPTEKADTAIDDNGLGVVTRQPRIMQYLHINLRVSLQIVNH